MTEQATEEFRELISPFLREKLSEIEQKYGRKSKEYQAIARQYVMSEKEKDIDSDRQQLRHYDADMSGNEADFALKGVERLYKRTVVLEPTFACLSHCRWCLRSQYGQKTLTADDVLAAVEYFSRDEHLREILITGGDPLIVPPMLEFVLDKLEERVPQIEIVRIGTRLLTQNPKKVDSNVLRILGKKSAYRKELGIHICHPLEFWPESVVALKKVMDLGIRLYNQHPLLKGINDSEEVLIELYDKMRFFGIEPHYLFHCVPMRGMDHFRTTLQKGVELISKLDCGGYFSGRSKPHYTAMTEIGKIVLYHGSIADRNNDDNLVLLKSSYLYEDRILWNPSWVKPDSCVIGADGYMSVWYPDGNDDAVNDAV